MTDPTGQLEMFSREWYNEYFRRAASSRVHSEFCTQVYGRDLCQHGLMDIAELDFLISLLKPASRILEIGCSNGFITEYIHDRTGCSILGLDFSDAAIEQARERTRAKSGKMRFECVDLTTEEIPGSGYDYVILIDSIYFLGDFEDTLPRFYEKIGDSGQMILSVFQTKDDDDPDEVLLADHTYLAQALRALQLPCDVYDFTENVRAHGFNNYRVAAELKEAFIAEGNQFLYEARDAENGYFREHAENETLTRYMYVVGKT